MAKAKTLRIRMVRQRIVQNGDNLHTYAVGMAYTVPESLGLALIAHRDAVEDKMLDRAPETKSLGG